MCVAHLACSHVIWVGCGNSWEWCLFKCLFAGIWVFRFVVGLSAFDVVCVLVKICVGKVDFMLVL